MIARVWRPLGTKGLNWQDVVNNESRIVHRLPLCSDGRLLLYGLIAGLVQQTWPRARSVEWSPPRTSEILDNNCSFLLDYFVADVPLACNYICAATQLLQECLISLQNSNTAGIE